MHEILRHVGIFLLIHRAVGADEVPGLGIGQHVLHHRLIPAVDVLLGTLANVNIAKAAGRPLHTEHGVEHEGIFPVVIPALAGLVLRGVQHRVPHEVAVVQHCLFVLLLLVIPVHHHAFLRGVHSVVIHIFADIQPVAAQLARQFRVRLLQSGVVLQLHMEHVGAVLDLGDTRLPEEIQNVHRLHGNVAQPTQLAAIPEHTVDGRAADDLVPPAFGVGSLKARLLQHHRHDGRQLPRLLHIPRLTGQDVGGGEVVHGVGVLVGDRVQQPRAHRLHLLLFAALPQTLPVPQPIPLLIVDHPLLQIGLALLVLPQGLHRLPQLLRTDADPHRRIFRCHDFFFFHHSISLTCIGMNSGALSTSSLGMSSAVYMGLSR